MNGSPADALAPEGFAHLAGEALERHSVKKFVRKALPKADGGLGEDRVPAI